MASKPNIDDVKLLQEALATKLEAITTSMVEAVLTGVITSHQHDYTTSTDVSNLINTAIASVYKPKGNIANKTALLALTNIKQGDVYNAQSVFTLNGQNVKVGDNIVCLADAATSLETNWDNLGGNIDFAAALSQALIGFSATSGNITSSDTILSAINKLAYDKHIHSNLNVLDLTTAAFTTALKNNYDTAYTHSQTPHAPSNALPNREIKVNGTSVLNSSNSSPINISNSTGTKVSYGYSNGEYIVAISAYMGVLTDINSIDLQAPGEVGVWTLIPGQPYTNTPNPICGTDKDESINLSGTYTYVSNSDGGTWTYHDQNTNKMYISSWYNHPVQGLILKPWERLLTCRDEPQTIQADIEAESIYHLPIPATGTTDYTFYLNGFDGKNGNKIEIDLATIAGSVNMNKRVVEIYVSPAQPNIDVSFYCAGLNSFTPTASYTDPLLVSGNIYYMKFIFLKQTTYWSVDNNIAYF